MNVCFATPRTLVVQKDHSHENVGEKTHAQAPTKRFRLHGNIKKIAQRTSFAVLSDEEGSVEMGTQASAPQPKDVGVLQRPAPSNTNIVVSAIDVVFFRICFTYRRI